MLDLEDKAAILAKTPHPPALLKPPKMIETIQIHRDRLLTNQGAASALVVAV